MLRKYCEIEICPWHVPSNLRRAKFKQNGKKKVHRNKTESKLLEKCNQKDEQETDASTSAKTIPSENEANENVVKNDMERTKDKSEDINESQEKEMVTAGEKSSESIKTTKNRPKTAPPIQQQVVVSYFIESVKV